MTWKSAYLETRVLSADPVELINILYEYATLRVQDARTALAEKDIPARSKAISKTIAILGELDSSLDHQAGGEIAANLTRLYQYMRERLTFANINQEDAPLAEVEGLLKTLGEAWEAIAAQKEKVVEEATMTRTPVEWSLVPMNAMAMMDSMTDFCAHSWSA